MKRVISFILTTVMCVLITACGRSNEKAFETSKAAYDNISTAYEIIAQYGTDLYEAWRLGIYDKEELLKDGFTHFATTLSLSEEELKEGACYMLAELTGNDISELSGETKDGLMESIDALFYMEKDSLFDLCVMIVTGAYTANGKIEKVQNVLDTAKAQMKELSEEYSDYEHYPSLKGYYTTTSSFFDFCQSPTGSFEQVIETINDYKNKARDYISDLDYIFED